MDESRDSSQLSFTMLFTNSRGVPNLDLSTVSLPETSGKLKPSATEGKLPKCNWSVAKAPRQIFHPKRFFETPSADLKDTRIRLTQIGAKVDLVRENLMSTYLKPRPIDRLAEIVSTPNIKKRIKPFNTQSIDKMLHHVEATELRAPKHLTVMEIFEKKVQKSIAKGRAMLRGPQSTESQSIIHATLYKRVRLIEAFLDASANDLARVELANSSDQYGRTALHYACFMELKQVICMLFVAGADPLRLDVNGRTCLHYAAMHEYPGIIEMILQNLKAVRETRKRASDTTNNNTIAENIRFLNLLKLVKSNIHIIGACRDEGFKEVKICLDFAELTGEAKEILTKIGVSDQVTSKWGPNDLEANRKNSRFIDIQDYHGKTALHLAVEAGASRAVRLLIDYGANQNLEDFNRQRPVELATTRHLSQLLQRGTQHSTKIISRSFNANPSSRYFKARFKIDLKDLHLMSYEDIQSFTEGESHNSLLM